MLIDQYDIDAPAQQKSVSLDCGRRLMHRHRGTEIQASDRLPDVGLVVEHEDREDADLERRIGYGHGGCRSTGATGMHVMMSPRA